jgi:hypothetical protein
MSDISTLRFNISDFFGSTISNQPSVRLRRDVQANSEYVSGKTSIFPNSPSTFGFSEDFDVRVARSGPAFLVYPMDSKHIQSGPNVCSVA